MRLPRRSSPVAGGSSWTCAAAGSSWTREAQQQRGSSWTRTAALLTGSSWTREAQPQRGSSWTREAQPQRGSSWTREAQPQRGSSWTRALPKTLVAGLAALAMGAAGAPAFAAGGERPLAAPEAGGSVLVRTDAAHLASVAAAVTRHGGTVLRTLSAVGILEVTLPGDQLAALRRTPGVLGTTRNGAVKLQSDTYSPAGDVNSLTRAAQTVGLRGPGGFVRTGAGVDVALVDSGVAPVPGLNGADKVVHGPDLSFESQNPSTRYLDTFGHGTHLAGIIAGHDAGVDATKIGLSDYSFVGVAPDARILSVKVADAHGNSDVSQVIAGIDWVVEHAHDQRAHLNVRVLNLSFGTDAKVSYLRDPLAQAVEVAWQRGIVVVVSAGNRGTSLGHLTDPAIDPYVVAVAAGNNAGGVTDFSSRGDGVRNPDVTAPGAHIPSLNVPGSLVDTLYGATAKVNDRLIRGSGTSQAAAFVSGLVADMLEAHPGLTPDEAKFRLRGTATPLVGSSAEASGAGLVSARAIDDTTPRPALTAATASVSDSATAGIAAPAPVTLAAGSDAGDTRAAQSAAAQSFARSTGDGPISASRGSYILVNNQVALDGERDVWGHSWDSASLAKRRAKVSIWDRGVYNGTVLAGSAWGGSAWGGSAWGGSAWGGSAWGGSAWGGSAWGGSAWG
jgi:serine protease AprX